VSAAGLVLGAPGVYERPPAPLRELTGARMDVCAFVGVAPRGPARVPFAIGGKAARSVAIAVESFDEYVRLYGSFEGAGLLPFAVASFFDQGGSRAYVVRIVPDFGDERDEKGASCAVLTPLATPVTLWARNEGSWGDRLSATLTFARRPLAATGDVLGLTLPPDVDLPAGSLLLLRLPGGIRELRVVAGLSEEGRPDVPKRRRIATFDAPVGAAPEVVEVVEATLEVDDGAGRSERHEHVGLSPAHPRFLAGVLFEESDLLLADPAWSDRDVLPASPELQPAVASDFNSGLDRAHLITPEDFFDSRWTFGDEDPGDGVHALVALEDLSLVAAPDLYSPRPLEPVEPIVSPVSLAGPEFALCVDPVAPPEQDVPLDPLDGLALDPRLPADRKRIVELQLRLHDLAALLRSWVVLLDVPPGLNQRQMLAWRTEFDSAYAAAYHPWLQVARGDRRLVTLNPSAVAAGIVAGREHRLGVPFGPFNELANQVVDVLERVPPARHDELHQVAINVFLRERDGVRLSAGRTLSRDPDYRQLSVRRLVTMLKRAVSEQVQWAVFEPNTPSLRADLRHLLEGFLRRLARAGAFSGATDEQSFFVRCDASNNPPPVVDAGRLVVDVGVAPAEPLEFIVLRIERDGDGTLSAEAGRG
jgi:uncharacterized protein